MLKYNYFSLFPQFKIKLKGHHFDTTELIEQNRRRWYTPSQNTTSRMRLKMAETLETLHTSGRGLLRG
jgi:hypothetical protein